MRKMGDKLASLCKTLTADLHVYRAKAIASAEV